MPHTSDRPSLFSFATGELSQDAILAWLLAWADESFAATDPALHEAGCQFVETLFEVARSLQPVPAIQPVEGRSLRALPERPYRITAETQRDRIDIIATVNDTHLIVIEDKVHAGETGDQLSRYPEQVRKRFSAYDVALLYLKTGEQASYKSAHENGWAVVERGHLLGILQNAVQDSDNAILHDYFAHLSAIEETVQSFTSTNPKDWKDQHVLRYSGFFKALAEALGQGDWGYVSNPRGGFPAFWWSHLQTNDSGSEIYLQLEADVLVAKIHVPEKETQSVVRNRWITRICDDLHGFAPPKHRRRGATMTLAVHRGSDEESDSNSYFVLDSAMGSVDVKQTAEHLRRIASELAALIGRHGGAAVPLKTR